MSAARCLFAHKEDQTIGFGTLTETPLGLLVKGKLLLDTVAGAEVLCAHEGGHPKSTLGGVSAAGGRIQHQGGSSDHLKVYSEGDFPGDIPGQSPGHGHRHEAGQGRRTDRFALSWL